MAQILIVDDEAGIRDFLAEALVGDGHEVCRAADGTDALTKIQAQPFDLMVTDLKMPGRIDGIDLLKRARQEQPGLEVAVLTAHGTVDTAVQAMKLGAFDYLEKPLASPGQFRTLVRRGLARRAMAGPRHPLRTRAQSDDPIEQLGLEVAQALGPGYAVADVVGRGGLAIVFRVHDKRLDRELAVKALYPEFGAHWSVAAQFRREARTAARLNHPNIVPVFFVGRESDVPCLVMPLIEGESLGARLRRQGRLSLQETLGIATDVAGALDAAHRIGVVHRDVKPDNILLERASGRALLTDFGIAKAVVGDPSVTIPGMMVGTPYYVSPEQAAGERELDARSDVYSFGVVLYEALAGRPPFDDNGSSHPRLRRVLMEHAIAPYPTLLARRPDLSDYIDAVIEKAMAKDPASRFASAGELVEALREAAQDAT